METSFNVKRMKNVRLYIDDNLFKEMVIESFDGRYPVIRIGWRKPVKAFNDIGESYEQYYFKFEFKELSVYGVLHYTMTDLEGIEVQAPEEDESEFLVYHDNILSEEI